jgi:hypothetical protein
VSLQDRLTLTFTKQALTADFAASGSLTLGAFWRAAASILQHSVSKTNEPVENSSVPFSDSPSEAEYPGLWSL